MFIWKSLQPSLIAKVIAGLRHPKADVGPAKDAVPQVK